MANQITNDQLITMWKLPRDEAHKMLYRLVADKELDLSDPKNLNEKLQWLIVYRYDQNVAPIADKIAVRDYVRSRGLGDILTELYGVYRSSSEIDYSVLPEKFVLKCNHASGKNFYRICTDKFAFDVKEAAETLDHSLKVNYTLLGLEYHYQYISPLIMCEEYIEEPGELQPTDYKFYCYSGVPKFVKVISGRDSGIHQDYYDMDWNHHDFVKDQFRADELRDCPKNFERMKEIAAKLSEPFSMARVDLYNIDGRIYFGEITLTPAMGINRTDKPEALDYFGTLMDIHYEKFELLEFPRTDEEQSLLEKASRDGGRHSLEVRLLKAAADIQNQLEHLDVDAQQQVMEDCSKILSSDASDMVKNSYATILYRFAFFEERSLEECWQIYWTLNRALFVNHRLKISDGSLQELYSYIFDFVKGIVLPEGAVPIPKEERSKRIVMTTSQFLGIGHAPTLRVLDYSYVLKHDLGYDITIINDAGMNYYRAPYLEGVANFNFAPEYNDKQTIRYKDEEFEFLQVSRLMPDLDTISILVNGIYEMRPALVFNIGGSCLTSDLCDCFTTVVTLPCSFGLPVTTCSTPLVGRTLEESDLERLRLYAPNQHCIETNFNYRPSESEAVYDRASFGIPESAFAVCAVGNRLGDEINHEFIRMMDHVLLNNSKIVFVLIGGITEERQNSILDGIDEDYRDRVVFTGSVLDARELIRHTDLLVNPDRSGGGRASFEAFCYGIPQVSLRRGDAYYAGGSDFGVGDWDSYASAVFHYADDPEYRKKMSAKATERAEKLSDIVNTLTELINKVI